MKKHRSQKYTYKSSAIPATHAMLTEVRNELVARIRSVSAKISAFKSSNETFRSEITEKLENLTAEIHRLGVVIEEQNARNLYVLDGLSSLYHRQERVETDIEKINSDWNLFRK